MKVEIASYQKQWAHHFYELNVEWLRRYFVIEPIDEKVLQEPEEYILKPGGEIWFALVDGQVVGTAALRRLTSGEWELTKMAVNQEFRGLGIGQSLIDEAFRRVQAKGESEVLLYSSTVLENAIHLYRKNGFMEIDLEPGVYKRADIKMRKYFSRQLGTKRRAELIESLRSSPERLRAALTLMNEQAFSWSEPGRWSIEAIMQHLVDSEMHGALRLAAMLSESGTEIKAYNQDALNASYKGNFERVWDNLELFTQLRLRNTKRLFRLDEAEWNNTVLHPERGELNVHQWLMIYESHTHLGQINRTYAKWKEQIEQK